MCTEWKEFILVGLLKSLALSVGRKKERPEGPLGHFLGE